MAIVVLHVGGLIWIILADWPSNEISGWRMMVVKKIMVVGRIFFDLVVVY